MGEVKSNLTEIGYEIPVNLQVGTDNEYSAVWMLNILNKNNLTALYPHENSQDKKKYYMDFVKITGLFCCSKINI